MTRPSPVLVAKLPGRGSYRDYTNRPLSEHPSGAHPHPVDRYQYLILMAGCLLLTLPLEFLFGARVWRRPKRLAIAVAPTLAIFVIWDLWATAHGTWDFDRRYTIGVELPGGMVVEELVFFVTIPVCTLLTLESVRNILDGVSPLQRWMRSR